MARVAKQEKRALIKYLKEIYKVEAKAKQIREHKEFVNTYTFKRQWYEVTQHLEEHSFDARPMRYENCWVSGAWEKHK
jgi:hypothetical protein